MSDHHDTPRPPSLHREPIEADREAGTLESQAIFAETVDNGGWSLTLHFGKGDDGRDQMRRWSDYLRPHRLATPAAVQEAEILKGVGRINGDGWKDTTKKGEVVYVWNRTLEPPYAPGQYPRVGNEIWSATAEQYDFTPATVEEVQALFAAFSTPAASDAEAETLLARACSTGSHPHESATIIRGTEWVRKTAAIRAIEAARALPLPKAGEGDHV